jgi:hypothetical protein
MPEFAPPAALNRVQTQRLPFQSGNSQMSNETMQTTSPAQHVLTAGSIFQSNDIPNLDRFAALPWIARNQNPRQAILSTSESEKALLQSLLIRILTPLEYNDQSNTPAYGSHLYDLIGKPNDEHTRNLARGIVLQAISQEERICRVIYLHIYASRTDPACVDIDALLLLNDSRTPLNLYFPFYLNNECEYR